MGSDETEVLHYLEKYATVFNSMAQDILHRSGGDGAASYPNPFNQERLNELLSGETKIDANKLMQHQFSYLQKQSELWQEASRVMMGETIESAAPKGKKDKRFSHQQWDENPIYRYIKESYLINAEMLTNTIDSIEFADPRHKDQAKFFTRQYVNSLSPTNFVLTNPDVCEEILATKGESLIKGMQAYLEDLEESPLEAFKMRQTDASAFTLGENLAYTPGEVVYRNELIELIHYAPTGKTQHSIPALVVPPFINKFYVMDLEEKKSLAKGLLDSGYNVFMISWVNADSELGDNDLFDYMRKGPLAAIEAVKQITEQDKVNLTGFCVGGTLSAMTTAYLRGIGDESIGSLTLLTTLLDFSQPGEVGNYFSEDMLPMIEQNAEIKGVFDGRIIAMSFSLLRENSLFWSFFIDNYLKGKDPAPFDILYWNSDSTNIPAACFKQYLRLTYWENKLKNPGEIVIDGVPIDLGNIDVPTYFLTTVADHIVLWKSAYEGTKLVSGDTRFVLAGSGHIAGVINPTNGGKYPHWTNDTLEETPEKWFEGVTEQAGSWWQDWHKWLKPHSGKRKAMPAPGSHEDFPSLGAAPGSYVLKRLE
ncbi:class I poly(R)-hydroxyalkanoic acid synthase [Glaciecola sp. XM2]|uniref:PHA/PHB synthase family protein n=1 Tax=Glaciecola sp. XM2 TaxID=1914931 RepID=UPI001BDEBE2B|nr:class I poly(R)-hydroxyalkanoic acid synthase [Glaciecola sp. XM2]MBT1451636.1 class I poly(R)-hydroxyalkanoic acid synthase [Glaciecola sp. XM2]